MANITASVRTALIHRDHITAPSVKSGLYFLNTAMDSADVPDGKDTTLGASQPSDTTTKIAEWVEGSAVIGRYHLLERIGEGGMGEVWLAEQREPLRRRVAVKLIKPGMDTREVIARFESERQALALMDHPAIAKVFDAGATPQGAPYFVMEYVAGTPITAYCDHHRLSTRERLELFIRVCEGVQHAHQKAIIHRDLKPSNILVAEVDGRAVPKIIDFGLAKALTHKLTADTLYTRVGVLIGTWEYMSPEQADLSREDIDTRTDVYSLGIIFYELLAGAPPLQLRKVAFQEFLRRLREEDPPKPSTKIRTQDPATSTDLAQKRGTEPSALVRQIRGDLDLIALKALEKERSQRYGSPSDFAADLGRYLRNEAVLAAPPSAAYRARKFARRYRVPLATACAFALVLIVAALVSIRQSIRANREAIRANSEAAVAQAVNDFLQNDLLAQASAANQAGPSTKPDPDLKVRTALDRAAAKIAGKFDRQPEVEAAIRDTIGRTYSDLGLYPEAYTQFERALELQRRVLGPESSVTLKTLSLLANTASLQGKGPEAESLFGQALKIQRRILGPEHPDTLYSMTSLSNVYRYQGKYGQAESLQRQVLQIQRRILGPEHPDTLKSMVGLAYDYDELGRNAEAEALASQALQIRRRVLGPEHPDTLKSIDALANMYDNEGKYAQAEALHDEALQIQRRVMGPDHPDTLSSMNNLAMVYYEEGKFEQAIALHVASIEINRRVLGPEHRSTLIYMNNLANAYEALGKYEQAESLHRQTLEIRRRVLGPEHHDTLLAMNDLADALYAQGKYEEAETLFRKTLEISQRVLGPEHPHTLVIVGDFASMYERQGNYDLAVVYGLRALTGRRRTFGSQHPDTMASAADLSLAYVLQGKFAQGEPLAREAWEFNRVNRPDTWQQFRAESLLGASLAGQKKYAEAEPLLLEGYQGMAERKPRIEVPDWYHIDRARDWLVELYRAQGSRAKAAEWSKK